MSEANRIPHVLLRWCPECKEALTTELGRLCKSCLENNPQVPLLFVHSTIASSLGDLKKLEDRGYPLAKPLREAFENIRRAFDGLEVIVAQSEEEESTT